MVTSQVCVPHEWWQSQGSASTTDSVIELLQRYKIKYKPLILITRGPKIHFSFYFYFSCGAGFLLLSLNLDHLNPSLNTHAHGVSHTHTLVLTQRSLSLITDYIPLLSVTSSVSASSDYIGNTHHPLTNSKTLSMVPNIFTFFSIKICTLVLPSKSSSRIPNYLLKISSRLTPHFLNVTSLHPLI